jgi:phage terminase large subunit
MAREILAYGERYKAIICDHDAEGRATLERYLGAGTTAAKKEVGAGIQAVAQRLKPAGDGRPRLSLMREGLVYRDALLDERKLPCCTEEEVESYVWDTMQPKLNPDGNYRKEEPLKLNDHGMDAMRYMVAYLDLRDPREAAIMQHASLVQGERQSRKKDPLPTRWPDGWPEMKF